MNGELWMLTSVKRKASGDGMDHLPENETDVIERIRAKYPEHIASNIEQRIRAGYKKYGPVYADKCNWMKELEEELMDAAVYVEFMRLKPGYDADEVGALAHVVSLILIAVGE